MFSGPLGGFLYLPLFGLFQIAQRGDSITTEKVKRKLAAILSADVKGYSRLMKQDEVATVETLKAYREVMSALIQKNRGRVVDSPGDNILAEFTSVVEAVGGAVEMREELRGSRQGGLTRNGKLGLDLIVTGEVI